MVDRGYVWCLVYLGMLFNIVGFFGMVVSYYVLFFLGFWFVMGVGVGMA